MTLADPLTPDAHPTRGARVAPIPPPLYYGAAFAAGMLIRTMSVPLDIGARPVTTAAGAALLAAAATLIVAGLSAVHRQHTTIVPHHAVAALVTTGAYRRTRNPMYTGLAVAYLGGALIAGSWWPLLTLPLALLAVRILVIGPEERYLADRFPQTYLHYRSRTRRWL